MRVGGISSSAGQLQVMAIAHLVGGMCPQHDGVAGVTWGWCGRWGREGLGENVWELGALRSRWRRQASCY